MSVVYPEKLPLIVLAGGFGTRLRSVDSERPKPMVEVAGRPFLYWLIEAWYNRGCRWFILSTGYKSEQIANYPWARTFPEAAFSIFREEKPLGTGGAVRAIYREYPTLENTLVVNGDTYLSDTVPALTELEAALKVTRDALFAVQNLSQLIDAKPNLVVQGDTVVGERDPGDLFDAGTVLVSRRAVERYAGDVPCKLTELLEPAMKAGAVGYSLTPGSCYDIGTPERYHRFEEFLRTGVHPTPPRDSLS